MPVITRLAGKAHRVKETYECLQPGLPAHCLFKSTCATVLKHALTSSRTDSVCVCVLESEGVGESVCVCLATCAACPETRTHELEERESE